jgi:hypothetical protein
MVTKQQFHKMTCYIANYTGAMKASLKSKKSWLTTADRNKISAVDQLILITCTKKDLTRLK